MEKTQNRKKIIVFLFFTILFSSLFLFCGCIQSLSMPIIFGVYNVDKLVYTDTPQKYINGRTLLSGEIEDPDSTTTFNNVNLDDLKTAGIYVVPVNDTTVDIIVDTTFMYGGDYNGANINNSNNNIFFANEHLYFLISGRENIPSGPLMPFVITSNQGLFSSNYGFYMLDSNYTLKTNNSSCSCGIENVNIDFGTDYDCACKHPNGNYSYNGQTLDYDPNLPTCCWKTTQIPVENAEGEVTSYNYYIENICSCKISAEYSAPSHRNIRDVSGDVNEVFGDMTNLRFNELIIDGFDLGYYDSIIDGLINAAKEYPEYEEFNYESYLDLTNYSHMFDGLNVKKISLNNIYGNQNEIKNLSYMFANCPNLVSVDFGNFFEELTPTDISFMFCNCPNLAYVDLSTLNTSEVTNMENMFNTGGAVFNTREEYLDYFTNYALIPLLKSENLDVPNTNNGEPWTFETITHYLVDNPVLGDGMTYEMARVQLMMVAIATQYNTSFKMVASYDEAVLLLTDGEHTTLTDYVTAVNENPTNFGLTQKENGELYTENEVMSHIVSEAKKALGNSITFDIVKTEDVDEMFLYLNGTNNFNNRNEELNFLLQKSGTTLNLLSNMLELSSNSIPQTIEEFANIMLSTANLPPETSEENAIKVANAYVSFLAQTMGFTPPITFNDASIMLSLITEQLVYTIDEFLVLFNLDPTKFGYEEKIDNTEYTLDEIKSILEENMLLLAKNISENENTTINLIENDELLTYYDKKILNSVLIDFYKFVEVPVTIYDRDAIINSHINAEFIEYLNTTYESEIPTDMNLSINNLVTYLLFMENSNEELKFETLEEIEQFKLQIKQKLILDLIMVMKHNDIPVTYDELTNYGFNMSFSEFVVAFNEDPSIFDMPAKEDGSVYSELEIKEWISNITFEGLGFNLVLQDKLETKTEMKTIKVFDEQENVGTTIVLGGNDSRFVINENMNTKDMFGSGYFSTIIAPTIQEGVEVELGGNYYLHELQVDSLTSNLSNKTLTTTPPEAPVDPEPEPENPSIDDEDDKTPENKTLTIVLVCVAAALFFVVVAIIIYFIIKKKINKK